MSTKTSVDPLDINCAIVVDQGRSIDPFTNAVVQTLRLASEDQLDKLEQIYPNLVYAERERRQHPARLHAVAVVRPRNQCLECGWPMFDGYQNAASNDGDVDPYGFCRNPECDNQY